MIEMLENQVAIWSLYNSAVFLCIQCYSHWTITNSTHFNDSLSGISLDIIGLGSIAVKNVISGILFMCEKEKMAVMGIV